MPEQVVIVDCNTSYFSEHRLRFTASTLYSLWQDCIRKFPGQQCIKDKTLGGTYSAYFNFTCLILISVSLWKTKIQWCAQIKVRIKIPEAGLAFHLFSQLFWFLWALSLTTPGKWFYMLVFPLVFSRRNSFKNDQINASKILMCWEKVDEEDLIP